MTEATWCVLGDEGVAVGAHPAGDGVKILGAGYLVTGDVVSGEVGGERGEGGPAGES